MTANPLPHWLEAGETQTQEFKSSFDKACIEPPEAVAGEGVDVGVNVGVNAGVNVGVNSLLQHIKDNPGQRAGEMSFAFSVTRRTIERWLKQLKDQGQIEFRGAPKTGGYFSL